MYPFSKPHPKILLYETLKHWNNKHRACPCTFVCVSVKVFDFVWLIQASCFQVCDTDFLLNYKPSNVPYSHKFSLFDMLSSRTSYSSLDFELLLLLLGKSERVWYFALNAFALVPALRT